MERRQLECLLAIIETGSFQGAAERLFVSQSAVSQAVKALEGDLGESLLHRPPGGRGAHVSLTAAGQLLEPIAREILRRFEEGRQAVADLRGLLIGRLALGAVDVAATYHLPGPLREFKRGHPGLDFTVQVAGSQRILDGLRSGVLDLAFVLGHEIPPGLAGRFYRDDPMEVVAPRDLLAGARGDLKALAAQGWISYPRASVTRGILEEAFARAGLPFPVQMEIDRPEVILQLVRAGLGLAVLPARLLDVWGIGEEIVRLAMPGLEAVRPIQIVHRPAEGLSPAARAFMAHLEA